MNKLRRKKKTALVKSELPANEIKQRPANRRANGQFLPGCVANPTGRPKTKLVSDAYRAILDEHGADELANVVYRDAIYAGKASDRLAAVQEITDRVEGKSVQAHRMLGDTVDAQTAQMLAELASRLAPTINIAIIGQDSTVTNRPLNVTTESDETTQGNQ
jgi:hypothetical protein